MDSKEISFDKSFLSTLVTTWAAEIDLCNRALNVLSERFDDQPDDQSLLLLVQDKLNNIQHKINGFNTNNI